MGSRRWCRPHLPRIPSPGTSSCSAVAAETLENRTLMWIAKAIQEHRADFDDAGIWALSQEALGLLDALIERRIS